MEIGCKTGTFGHQAVTFKTWLSRSDTDRHLREEAATRMKLFKRLRRFGLRFLAGKSGHLACSDCFQNHGLKLDAQQLGADSPKACPNCGSRTGKKLDDYWLNFLAYRFFDRGTMVRGEYG